MQQKVKKGVKMVKQELKEREEVEADINIVKSWIQETKEYLLSPDVEVDTQLQELQVYQICQFLNNNIYLCCNLLARVKHQDFKLDNIH